MLALLYAIEKNQHPRMIAFLEQQTKTFAEIGFRFTPPRILLISLGAGIGEELLFRGAFQGWFAHIMPLALAILIPAIVFGALHYYNLIYMILAAVIGVYLGIAFALTHNIAVPIIAHAVYDIIALHRVNIKILQHRPGYHRE